MCRVPEDVLHNYTEGARHLIQFRSLKAAREIVDGRHDDRNPATLGLIGSSRFPAAP